MKKIQKDDRRLSGVDWLLILLVAILALAALSLWGWSTRREEAILTFEYTVLLENLPLRGEGERQAWDFILTGGEVYNQNGTALLGRVSEYRVVDHKEMRLVDGEARAEVVPDRRDVWIRIRAEGVSKIGDGVRISDVRIAAGMRGDFRLGNYDAKGARVLWVEEVPS